MALHEINAGMLKKNGGQLFYRFLQDPAQAITLHIWQNKNRMEDAPIFGVEKFQIAHAEKIIEWNGKSLRYGSVDSGENGFGVKESPLMMMETKVSREELLFCRTYLGEPLHLQIPGVRSICHILDEGIKQNKEDRIEV